MLHVVWGHFLKCDTTFYFKNMLQYISPNTLCRTFMFPIFAVSNNDAANIHMLSLMYQCVWLSLAWKFRSEVAGYTVCASFILLNVVIFSSKRLCQFPLLSAVKDSSLCWTPRRSLDLMGPNNIHCCFNVLFSEYPWK